jgi:signal transduction histidine kinase/CheY-like chemotaxis protein/HPt (histidine-containing phosphotransfer) domain-containing protein
MDEQKKDLSLLELVDMETLKSLQNVLHETLGISTGLADLNGVAIAPHESWTSFCGGHIKKSKRGLAACENCDRHGLLSAVESGFVQTYTCHTGLTDFAAPIIVDGKPIGCFLGGQVSTKPLTRSLVHTLAKRYEIDEESLWQASKTILVIPEEQIERAAKFAHEVSNIISRMAYQKYQLLEQNKEIMKAANMKSDFLANMSHEIRTPMNAVIGMAEMALREELSPTAREYVNQIISSGKTLLTIINDILDFSKIDSGKMEINEDEYEPLSIVNDVANIIMTRIGDKDLELVLDVDPELPYMLYGDLTRIKQVIVNLTNNAVKFTKKGKVMLKISFEKVSETMIDLQVSVEDTGMGIKKQDLDKLFQSFSQVDSKRNRNIEGTGLGLAISKHLLELMGGEIAVESEYEKGSTFSFHLPQRIINPRAGILLKEESAKVMALIHNDYVAQQLKMDVERLNCRYIAMESEDVLDTPEMEGVTQIFVEKDLFTDKIREFIKNHSDVLGIVLVGFKDSDSYDIPNLIAVKKPLYSLNVSQILNHEDLHSSLIQEGEEDFDFIAPDAEILIVDDNKVNLTVAEGLLEPLKMKIDTAMSGKEAIDMISKKHYDLIFMDHMMPEIDGVETTRLIRRFHPEYHDVPIIALTANAIEGRKEMFLNEGMNDFVAKPIELRRITSRLKYWLPKEKILKEQTDPAAKKEPQKKVEIHIEGLDTEYALGLLGSEKLFWDVLKDYYKVIEKKATLIKKMEMDSDWPGYTVEVHALKSASRQIGAIELSELAAALESAGNGRNIDMIHEHTDEMLNMYCNYIAILEPYITEDDEEEGTQGPIDLADLLKLFSEMRNAMDELEMDEMEKVVHELKRYEYDDVQAEFLSSLEEANENLDVDACESIISEWEKLL